MARWPRLAAPDVPMHITQRGNNRVAVFADSIDFAEYRSYLQYSSSRTGCAIHAYALMTNHVHLLVTPTSTSAVSRMMQLMGRLYVRHFNRRHRRSGTLWEGRFRSSIVDSSGYFLACSRYIDLNPLRAGIASTPSDYEWSSFRCLGMAEPDALLTPHPEYLGLGHTGAERARVYRAMCGAGNVKHSEDAIRNATRGGAALGGETFRFHMARKLQRPVTRLPHGGDRQSTQKAITLSAS